MTRSTPSSVKRKWPAGASKPAGHLTHQVKFDSIKAAAVNPPPPVWVELVLAYLAGGSAELGHRAADAVHTFLEAIS